MRQPYQVLVLPYYRGEEGIEYGIFQRSDAGWWQAIAGGVEEGETIEEAARRESWEEAEIPMDSIYVKLDSINSIPADTFADSVVWGEDLYIVKEQSFGVEIRDKKLNISDEHTEYKWMKYNEAMGQLKWDSNKTALWELNKRLSK